MTQRVQLPNGDIAEFPDDMSPDAIASALKQHPSTLEDVGKSAAVAPVKAAMGMLGLPGDIRQLTDAARKKLESYLPAEPEFLKKAEALARVANPISYLSSIAPTSGAIRSGVESVTGPLYDPQTRAGKVADTAVESGLMMGRNWLTNPVAAGLLTTGITAGTEGAGALTNDNPYARMAGGFVGGGIPALFSAMRSKPGSVVKDALGPMTQQDIDRAIQMQEQAKAAGVPLLGTESLDRGHQLASAVYASPSGNQPIESFLRQRPAQVTASVNNNLIAPTAPPATPNAAAAKAQGAAEGAISALEKDRSALVGPDYFRAQRQQFPQTSVDAAKKQILAAAATAPASDRGVYTAYLRDLSDANATNAGVLDDVYKRAREAANVSINASTADKLAARPSGVVRDILESLTGQNPNLARGRQQFQDFTRTQIEPVTSGPVGVVAGRSGFDPSAPSPVPRVLSTLSDTNTARPETIKQLYTTLNQQDPAAFPSIVRTHLENQLNAAGADIRTGPNPTAGAKFRQAIYGTPQDKANFDEMMRGVARAQGANPDAVVQGAHNLLDVLERTGRTPGIGSQTAPRGDIAKELGKTFTGDVMQTISLTPTRPLARRFNDFIARRRYSGIAEALTAPDSVQRLVQLAKIQPDTLTASYMVAAMLGLGKINENGQ